jgi:hypothetical protein
MPMAKSAPERREIEKIATSEPAEHDLPFPALSLAKLADFLGTEGSSTTSAVRATWPDAATSAATGAHSSLSVVHRGLRRRSTA